MPIMTQRTNKASSAFPTFQRLYPKPCTVAKGVRDGRSSDFVALLTNAFPDYASGLLLVAHKDNSQQRDCPGFSPDSLLITRR